MKTNLRQEDAGAGGYGRALDAGDVPLFGERIQVAGLGLHPADAVFLSTLLFFTVLMFARNGRDWTRIVENIAVGLVFLAAVRLDHLTSSRTLKFWIRLAAAQLMFAYVFPLVGPFQLMIGKGWNDAAVLNLERAVFGVQPTIWIQTLMSPALTEWMMFSYVMWLPLYPILCAVLYFKRGEQVMENFIFALAVANLACALGFILFPVAGPMYWIAGQYTVPLKGYLFTAAGEFVRSHFQSIGASVPSPHCACAMVMGLTAFRYHRPAFFVISPVIISIFISAFYGRYHYLSDVLTGILMGAASLAVAPFLLKAWNGWVGRKRAERHPDALRPTIAP